MRDRVVAASVGVSLALHGVVVLVLARRRIALPPPRLTQPIELVTPRPAARPTRVEPTPSAPTAPAPAPAAASGPRKRHGAARPTAAAENAAAETAAAETAAAATSTAESAAATRAAPDQRAAAGATTEAAASAPPPPRIDLFAPDALARAIPTPAPGAVFGGRLRRAGDPAPPVDDADAGRRVREMVSDLVGRERVRSGDLPPRWRDVERRLTQSFHPPLAAVKRENVAKALAHQVLRAWLDGPPRTGPVARGVDASVETLLGTPQGFNQRSLPEEQALATQARWGEPASWLRVVVDVTIDADGRIRASRVVTPSGRRAFDRVALAEVEAAVRAGGAPDERRAMTSRWSVEAAVAVTPPTSIGFRFDESGHLAPGATGLRKYLAFTHPFQQAVRTRVALLSIEPAP